MLISFWLSSLQSKFQRRSRTATRRSRKLASSQHISAEFLEDRQLLTVNFAAPINYTTSATPFCVVVGDFNADGKADVATSQYAGQNVNVRLGTSPLGTLGGQISIGGIGRAVSIAVGDFNKDGKQDLVTANYSSGSVKVLTGNGSGGFSVTSTFSPGGLPIEVAVGDFNNDTWQDLVIADDISNVSLILNNGAGGFGAPTSFLVGTNFKPASVTVGDFNGDGKQDLATANEGATTNRVSVLLGTGTGSFGAPTHYAAGTGSYAVRTRDLNGDGKLDLAVANPGSNSVSVLLGNGNGTFGATTNFATGTGPGSIAIADFDGDNKLDLVTTNSTGVSVLLGNGAGSFGLPTNFTVGSGPYFVTTADMNADGKMDLLTANGNVSSMSVRFNTSTPANQPPTVAATAAAVSANEGGIATNAGTFSDAQGNSTVTITASVGTVTQNNTNGTWSWSLNVADGPASGNVTITATDNQNAAANATFAYSVNNVAPTISLNGNATVNEGSQYTLNLGAVTDPGTDTITSYQINWGDGTNSGLIVGNPANTSATHTFADGPSTQTNNVTVTDEDGNFLAGTLSVQVLNVAPTADFQNNGPITYGQTATVSFANQNDASAADATAGFHYAYSQTGDFTGVTYTSGSSTSATHDYAGLNAGDYTVYARIIDRDGGFNDYVQTVTVNQADANITINAYSGTYDAASHNLTGSVTGVDAANAALGSSLTFGSGFTDAPGGTGTWNFEGGTNYLDESGTAAVTIAQADANVTINAYSGTYDAAAHNLTGSVTGVDAANAALGSSLTFGSSFTDAPGGTGTWNFEGGTNYLDESGTAAVTIAQADANVTINPYSGTYDAAAHNLTGSVAGVTGDAAAVGSSLTFGSGFTDAPGGTGTWNFEGGTNYLDESGTAAVTIAQADANVTINAYSGTYNAASHNLTGSVTGVTGDAAAVGSSLTFGSGFTDAPGGTGTWNFEGGTNYLDESGTAAVTIAKANQTITWSNPAAVNYGTPLSGTQLNATVAGVAGGTAAGALTYSPSAGAVLLAGTQTLMVSAAATTNYNLATASVSLVVNPWTSTGFLQPISLNRAFKQGSTVPIKWRVNDASGNPLTSLSAIANLTVTGPGGTTILYPGNNNSSGATVLRNDDGQYIFNWQTKGFVIGSYTISALLADGTSVTQTIMLSKSGAASGLVINGVTGTTVVGALLAGDVTVYVDNSTGGFSSDELARIDAAIAGIELLVSPYGANIFVVDGTVGLNANIVLASGTTSVLGGMAEGILGVSTSDGGITIIDGWNWYAGTDASAVGSGQFDFQTVITHEIAHSIGLGHSVTASSVMFPALATTEARRTMVFADLNTAGEEGNGSGLHAEAIYAASHSHNVASAGQDSSPLSPASNLELAGSTGFAATPLRSIVKELTTDKSLNVATADVSNSRDLNTGLRRVAKESAWRSAIGSSEVETLTDGQDIDSFFARLTDHDGEMLDNLMDSAFSELGN